MDRIWWTCRDLKLGNRNAERIRCFILGYQVSERLAAWNNARYGGGL